MSAAKGGARRAKTPRTDEEQLTELFMARAQELAAESLNFGVYNQLASSQAAHGRGLAKNAPLLRALLRV